MTEPADLTGPPTRGEVRELVNELAYLRSDMRRQDRRGLWNRRLIVALIVAVVCLLVIGGFTWLGSKYAVCNSNRTKALSGPGNDRVNLFLQAYNEAAGAIHKPLTGQQRTDIIAGLDKARTHFTVIPAHAALVKQTDPELLGLRDLVASLRANDKYLAAAKVHPVCSFWSL